MPLQCDASQSIPQARKEMNTNGSQSLWEGSALCGITKEWHFGTLSEKLDKPHSWAGDNILEETSDGICVNLYDIVAFKGP